MISVSGFFMKMRINLVLRNLTIEGLVLKSKKEHLLRSKCTQMLLLQLIEYKGLVAARGSSLLSVIIGKLLAEKSL